MTENDQYYPDSSDHQILNHLVLTIPFGLHETTDPPHSYPPH